MEEKTIFSVRAFFEELDKEGVITLLKDYMTDLRIMQQRYLITSIILSIIIVGLLAYILSTNML